ncbi:MAG: prolyl oligopeptidase family serine peptidase [Clostridia bacterium]|nr:prolyl oligopeptidase family serine peptidase [Clostridia bacterium]
MKNLMKILFTAFLAVSLLFAIGCGDEDASGTETKDTTVADTTAADTTAADTTAEDTTAADTEAMKPDPVETEFKLVVARNMPQYTFSASNGVELPYCLYVPDSYSDEYAYPLFMFLHGAGERSYNNGDQMKVATQNFFFPKGTPIYNSIAVFPLCVPDEGWSDNNWDLGSYSIDECPISDQMVAIIELLDYLIENYSINTNRQYVTGLSMGGYGTWDIIMRYPDRFAAAAPLCGGGDPSKAELLKDLPIWVFHDLDDDAVPVSGSQDMVNAIKAVGGENLRYTETQGLGHFIWDNAYQDPEFLEWMFSQVKK